MQKRNSFITIGNKEIGIPENKLWEQFLYGDSNAFNLIYNNSVNDLFNYGKCFSNDDNLIKDCIQDLFIDLYNYRSKLSKTNKIMPYLMISLRRLIIKKNKTESAKKHIDINNIRFEFEIAEENTSENEEKNIDALQSAMNELTARQREAIYLKFVSGFNYDQLASILNLNYQTSRNLIYHGMRKLRESLKNRSYILCIIFKKLFP